MNETAKVHTTIRVPPAIWLALRALAEGRALELGGRPNVSAVVAELVEAETARETARKAAPRG